MWQIENYKLYLGWYCPVFSSWHLFHGIAVIYWEGKAYGNTILLKGMLNQPRSWGSRSDSGGLDRLDEYGHWKANGFEEIYIVQPGAKSKEVTNQVLISVKKISSTIHRATVLSLLSQTLILEWLTWVLSGSR